MKNPDEESPDQRYFSVIEEIVERATIMQADPDLSRVKSYWPKNRKTIGKHLITLAGCYMSFAREAYSEAMSAYSACLEAEIPATQVPPPQYLDNIGFVNLTPHEAKSVRKVPQIKLDRFKRSLKQFERKVPDPLLKEQALKALESFEKLEPETLREIDVTGTNYQLYAHFANHDKTRLHLNILTILVGHNPDVAPVIQEPRLRKPRADSERKPIFDFPGLQFSDQESGIEFKVTTLRLYKVMGKVKPKGKS